MTYSEKIQTRNSFALVGYALGFLVLGICSLSLDLSINSYLLSWLLLASSYLYLSNNLLNLNKQQLKLYIVLVAVVKLAVIFLPVIFTGDWPRYIFEGQLLASGHNPYLMTPQQFINFPTPEVWQQIEYQHLSAIYPPIAILFFSVFAQTLFGWKTFILFLEIINTFILVKILAHKKIPIRCALLYFAAPLATIELGMSAHLDVLSIFFMLLSYHLYLTKKLYWKIALGIAFSLAFLTKYTPIIFIALVLAELLKDKQLKSILIIGGTFTVSTLVILLPFLGASYFSSLSAYLQYWRFNDSLLHLLGFIFQVDWQDVTTFKYLKYALLIFWIAAFTLIAFSKKSLAIKTIQAYLLFYLCSAVVHPWYVVWIVPFIPISLTKEARLEWGSPQNLILIFTLTILLSYQARILGLDEVNIVIKLIEYLPVVLFFAYELWLNLPFLRKCKTCSLT